MKTETMDVLAERLSRAGRRVRLTRECGRYVGAAPYYAVVYQDRTHRPQVSRYTPFREIAEHYLAKFLDDVTDPAGLADGRPVGVTKPPGCTRIPGRPPEPPTDPRPARESATAFVTSATPRTGARRGGRPRATAEPRTASAARMRRYRARRQAGAPALRPAAPS